MRSVRQGKHATDGSISSWSSGNWYFVRQLFSLAWQGKFPMSQVVMLFRNAEEHLLTADEGAEEFFELVAKAAAS